MYISVENISSSYVLFYFLFKARKLNIHAYVVHSSSSTSDFSLHIYISEEPAAFTKLLNGLDQKSGLEWGLLLLIT